MNLNIYLEDGLEGALTEYALRHNLPKNQVVRDAVRQSLYRDKKGRVQWSEAFIPYKGLSDEDDIFKRDYSMFKDDEFNKSWLDD